MAGNKLLCWRSIQRQLLLVAAELTHLVFETRRRVELSWVGKSVGKSELFFPSLLLLLLLLCYCCCSSSLLLVLFNLSVYPSMGESIDAAKKQKKNGARNCKRGKIGDARKRRITVSTSYYKYCWAAQRTRSAVCCTTVVVVEQTREIVNSAEEITSTRCGRLVRWAVAAKVQ